MDITLNSYAELLKRDRHQHLAGFYGLAALDTLRMAAALSVGVDELMTTEQKNKPMHRVPGLQGISIL